MNEQLSRLVRTGARTGRLITSILLPSLIAACESRGGGAIGESDGTAAGHAAESPDTPGGAAPSPGAASPDTPGGGAAGPAAESPGVSGVESAVDSVVRIGVVDGDDMQVFGRIRDVAVDDAANVYVLDNQALTVRWFDRRGAFRGAAGRAGGGPGEFRAPTAIVVDDIGLIKVLDAAYRRITTFAAVDTALHLVEEFTIPYYAVDFCRLGGRYFFLSAAEDDGIIHEVATDGTVLRSFGESPIEISAELSASAPLTQLMRDNGARGRLICVSDPPIVVLVPEKLPRVQAFTPDGALLWAVTLTDYHQQRWEFAPPNGVRMKPDPATGTAHTAMDASLMGADLIAITLHEGSAADPDGSLELRILSLEDGSIREPREATGILAAVRHNLEYSYVNNPFPQITITPIAARR